MPRFSKLQHRAGPQVVAQLFLAAALPLFATLPAMGQPIETSPKWSAFPDLQLGHVKIGGNSLSAAWQDLSRGPMLRTVLFNPEPQPSDMNQFAFDEEKCTVDELLKAFEKVYPNYVHDLDETTGLIWLHPRDRAYDKILTQKVKVGPGAIALPMLDGILGWMAGNPTNIATLGIYRNIRGLAGSLSALDYPVDLPEGTFSVKEILNFCLAENPGDGFYISKWRQGATLVQNFLVQNLDLGYRNISVPSETAVFFWHATIGPTQGAFPNPGEILKALSSDDIAIKERARGYMQMNQAQESWATLIANAKTPQEILWTAVAEMSVHERSDETGSWLTSAGLSVENFHEKLNELLASTNSVNRGLQVLAAITEAKWYPSNPADLKHIMAKQPANEKEIAGVRYDLIRILRNSPGMRKELIALHPPWAGFSKAEIEALSQDNIFSLP